MSKDRRLDDPPRDGSVWQTNADFNGAVSAFAETLHLRRVQSHAKSIQRHALPCRHIHEIRLLTGKELFTTGLQGDVQLQSR
ncbi:hypothetical protein [Pseudoclavibacter sp. CFCC 14310]|uniref:hypothetical protein n=1 Tax=Pseudoclavibacter sp. CFCC 14310 TaxID=2615180 RepID=UPI001CE3EFDA|nr:hypothetical protein [Pseudoclavibacter sp. CFCC 14310]